jgi:site-specific DNA-methyltransferase (adenine-specific)
VSDLEPDLYDAKQEWAEALAFQLGQSSQIIDVLEGRSKFTVLCADALLALLRFPSDSVDMLLTDPPYSSGGAFRGDRTQSTRDKYVKSGEAVVHPPDFEGDTRDQRAYTLWVSLWCAEALRIAKEGALGMLFTDWRQLSATVDAFQAGGWVFRGIVPWDKTEASRPRAGGFRSQCEYIVWGSKGPLKERPVYGDGCLYVDDVLAHPFREAVGKNKLHQAVKPVELFKKLVVLCPPGGVVLDAFAGSASAGMATLRAGLRYIGLEISPTWAELSRERLLAELDGSTLAARAAGQAPLFGE